MMNSDFSGLFRNSSSLRFELSLTIRCEGTDCDSLDEVVEMELAIPCQSKYAIYLAHLNAEED